MNKQTISLLNEIRVTLMNEMPEYLHLKIVEHINSLNEVQKSKKDNLTPVFCKTPEDQQKVLDAIKSDQTPAEYYDMVLLINDNVVESFTHLSDWDYCYALTTEQFLLTK